MKNNEFKEIIDKITSDKKNLEKFFLMFTSEYLKKLSTIDSRIVSKINTEFSNFINIIEVEMQKLKSKNIKLDKENEIYLEETAFDVCKLIISYWEVMIMFKGSLKLTIPTPPHSGYSTLQKIVSKATHYNKEDKFKLKHDFEKLNLPTKGFKISGLNFSFFRDFSHIPIIIGALFLCFIMIYSKSAITKFIWLAFALFTYPIIYKKNIIGINFLNFRLPWAILGAYAVNLFLGSTLDISGNIKGFKINAVGAAATFFILYFFNPKSINEKENS